MRRKLFATVCVLGALLFSGISSHAQLSGNATVFATGFNNPRGLKFGPFGFLLYVAEAGVGGTISTTGQCEQVPPPLGPATGGTTGRISAVGPLGNRFTLIDGLPSSQTQFLDALGPTDIEFVGLRMHVLIQAGCSKGQPEFPNAVMKLQGRTLKLVADLSEYIQDNPQNFPPDEDQDPEGNPYAFTVNKKRELLVIEANRSTVEKVAPNGTITRLADLAEFIQGYDTPVAVDIDGAGNVYVGSFSAVPFVAGTSTIYKITPTGAISVFAQGFTTLIDLAFDHAGVLYVLETSAGLLPPPQNTGRVLKLRNGSAEVVATGLDLPTAMTFGPDGALYVSNRGHGVGLAPGQGEVVRIEVHAPL